TKDIAEVAEKSAACRINCRCIRLGRIVGKSVLRGLCAAWALHIPAECRGANCRQRRNASAEAKPAQQVIDPARVLRAEGIKLKRGGGAEVVIDRRLQEHPIGRGHYRSETRQCEDIRGRK